MPQGVQQNYYDLARYDIRDIFYRFGGVKVRKVMWGICFGPVGHHSWFGSARKIYAFSPLEARRLVNEVKHEIYTEKH